ncbi:MAG: hypothetical protein WAW41_13225, partial [Methylobacter sp.]
KSTSSRQGLPGSTTARMQEVEQCMEQLPRSHGWQYRNGQQVRHRELLNKINRSHPCALDSLRALTGPAIPAGTTVYRRHLCITMSALRGNAVKGAPRRESRASYALHPGSATNRTKTIIS